MFYDIFFFACTNCKKLLVDHVSSRANILQCTKFHESVVVIHIVVFSVYGQFTYNRGSKESMTPKNLVNLSTRIGHPLNHSVDRLKFRL